MNLDPQGDASSAGHRRPDASPPPPDREDPLKITDYRRSGGHRGPFDRMMSLEELSKLQYTPAAQGLLGGREELPFRIDDPDARRRMEAHYEQRVSEYLSQENVPLEYRRLIKRYFSYEGGDGAR